MLAYDGGGNCSACLRTFLRYSARFAVKDWKASDCAGLFSLGVSNSSCTVQHRQYGRSSAQHSGSQHKEAWTLSTWKLKRTGAVTRLGMPIMCTATSA